MERGRKNDPSLGSSWRQKWPPAKFPTNFLLVFLSTTTYFPPKNDCFYYGYDILVIIYTLLLRTGEGKVVATLVVSDRFDDSTFRCEQFWKHFE